MKQLLPGERNEVVLAAIHDLPRMEVLTAEDAQNVAFLVDVRKRFLAYEMEQSRIAVARMLEEQHNASH